MYISVAYFWERVYYPRVHVITHLKSLAPFSDKGLGPLPQFKVVYVNFLCSVVSDLHGDGVILGAWACPNAHGYTCVC